MDLLLNYLPLNQISKTTLYYPVTLQEAKTHLRVDMDFIQDDDYIQGLIIAATRKAEEYIGKSIALTSNVIPFDNFMSDQIVYDEGNFNSLVSITTDASTTLTPKTIRSYRNCFYIELPASVDSAPLILTYKSGYDQGKCPGDIKQAILIIIGNLYDSQRSNYAFTSMQDTKAYQSLLDPHKILMF